MEPITCTYLSGKIETLKDRFVLWSVTLWLPRTACTASFKVLSLSWRFLNNCCPNLLSEWNASKRCSTDTYSSPISFLYFRELSKRELRCEPITGPVVSPVTCQIKRQVRICQKIPTQIYYLYHQQTHLRLLRYKILSSL